jgi:hypothetical protein
MRNFFGTNARRSDERLMMNRHRGSTSGLPNLAHQVHEPWHPDVECFAALDPTKFNRAKLVVPFFVLPDHSAFTAQGALHRVLATRSD